MRLALGTVQFGLDYGIANPSGQVSQGEAARILRIAQGAGVDMLDTAIAYGKSEQVMGALGVDGFKIVTKLPPLPDNLPNVNAWVNTQMEASLNRLKVESVYGVLLHRSENLLGASGHDVVKSLKRLKSKGVTHKIGVSVYDPSELDQTTQVIDVDLVQAPLNLVDRRLESSGWLYRLNAQGVEVHVRSVFLQGLLLLPHSDIPQKFKPWSHLWDAWHQGLNQYQTSAAIACLSYPLSLPEVDRLVVGVDTAGQFEELIRIAQTKPALNDWSFMISEDKQLINPSVWSSL